ncbi:9812_t:CDS:2 [Gigaspora rosea]|nr:9812_t:CDS:2 [Gigaspora rosea]
MHTKVFKLKLFSVLIVLLLNISCSLAGPIVYKTPHQLEIMYPRGVYIPSNFTIPDGNVFKFTLYLAAFIWYMCNGTSGQWIGDQYRSVYFNSKEDISFYPYSAVAELDFARGISAIPKFDTSTFSFTCIASEPSHDPKKDADNELCLKAKDGAAPPNEECGTKYPDNYIYSNVFTATILLYHNGTH